MPAFTVTAVDTTANTLASTGVAAVGQPEGSVLLTGDRLRLRNVGGALPAATPSLAGATDYWALRVDDNTIKIYDSNAHALVGGSTGLVDLTGSGSGTTTIEFGLPYSLPTVAGAGMQIRSVHLIAAWTALVALYCMLTGLVQSVWSSLTINVPLTVGGQLYFFTDFTFSAVAATDVCTATAHPLHTGLGPIRVPSTLGGLTTGTDYYAISLTANTFKFATSRANSIAGIAVDITADIASQSVNWQATTTRVCDAEVTRNLTVDGNTTVTGLIVANGGVSVSSGLKYPVTVPASAAVAVTGSPSISEDHWTAAAAGNVICYPIAAPVGMTISTVTVWYQRTSGTLTFTLARTTNSSGSQNTVAQTTDSGSGGLTSTTLTANHQVLAANQYRLKFTSGSAGDVIYAVDVA